MNSLELPRITIIYDNNDFSEECTSGFGFSCVVEWKGRRILFDTGGNAPAFFHNMKVHKIALEKITHVVFSHHHWDHTAGFEDVLATLRERTPIYVPWKFSETLLQKIPETLDCIQNKGFMQIDDDVYCVNLSGGSFCGCFELQEQTLILDTTKGLIVITGCAHPGIEQILIAVRQRFPESNFRLVLGGFHLRRSFGTTIDKIVDTFEELGVEKVAPCHCAGQRAFDKFGARFQENCLRIGTGSVLDIE